MGTTLQYFARFRTRRAIKAYARRLPRLLRKDYGGLHAYTPAQVRKTIERYRLDASHSSYAIAMFSDRDGFEQFHAETGPSANYDEIRSEVAAYNFGGDVNFSISDMWSESSGADGAHHSHGSDDGGGHGYSDSN